MSPSSNRQGQQCLGHQIRAVSAPPKLARAAVSRQSPRAGQTPVATDDPRHRRLLRSLVAYVRRVVVLVVLVLVALVTVVSPAGADTVTRSSAPVVALAATPSGQGYWQVAADGGVFSFGDASFYGSLGLERINAPVVGVTATLSGRGYWLVAADGGVFAFGDAGFYGSMGGQPLNAPVIGIAPTPGGKGYWLAAADGGVFAFGDAQFRGSAGGTRLNARVVGIMSMPRDQGYWLVAADGGVFSYGAAGFYGSMGGKQLNAPVVAGTSSHTGNGYRLVAADGGVFTFGDAGFFGSLGGQHLDAHVVSLTPVRSGNGYWMTGRDGNVFAFGGAQSKGRVTVTPAPVSTSTTRQPAQERTVSGPGVTFIKTWEGFSPRPYRDAVGVCTIGYGQVIPSSDCTTGTRRVSEAEATATLKSLIDTRYGHAVQTGLVGVPLTQSEFDALTSFTYNLGTGPITGTSGLRSALLSAPPQYAAVPGQLLRWTKGGGVVLCGLYRRRTSEANLWSTGSYAQLQPACPSGSR